MDSDRKLKIAVLIKKFITTGGAERYTYEVTRRLALQHEVHVFAQDWSYQGKEKIIFHRMPVFFKRPSWLNQIIYSYLVGKALGKNFDIIHSHEKVTRFDVMTIHSPCFRSLITKENKWWKRCLLWLSIALSPRKLAWLWLEKKQFTSDPNKVFIAVSEMVKNDVQSNYSLTDKSFCIAFPGVNMDMYAEEMSFDEIKRFRFNLGIDEDDLAVLFVGTEFKRKGLDALFKSLSLIHNPKIKLVIAGGGGGKMSRYVKMAQKLKLQKRITFMGLVKDIQKLYTICDAFVLPTLVDPCAMAPLEAMSAGLPTALSKPDYCGASGHVKNKEALIIENPRDHQEIAKIIRQFMDKEVRKNFGEKGRELVKELTWEKTTMATLSCYAKTIRDKYQRSQP